MNAGYIGAFLGVTFGFIGGLIGSYYSIKNTKGPLEKAFMKKVVVLFWIIGVTYLVFLLYLPIPYNFLLLTLFLSILPFFIRHVNAKLMDLQKQEEVN
ncbi:MAG: hypothetical protein ACP5C3_08745 [Methanomicrobiales archaeon]